MPEYSMDEAWLAQLKKDLTQALERGIRLSGRVFCRALFLELDRRSDDACLKCCRWLAENCERIAGEPELLLAMMEHAEAAAAKAWRSYRTRRAEAFALLLAGCGNVEWLAFLARRGEVAQPEEWPLSRLQALLSPGVSRFSAVEMVEMALTLMLGSGAEEDWARADALFAVIPPSQIGRVNSKWLPLMVREEVEGYLVMLMLQRHRLSRELVLPQETLLRWYLQHVLPDLPPWLRTDWQPTLADVYDESFGAHPGFVQVWLDRAPRTRAAAQQLLDAIGQYDDGRLYDALLDEDVFCPLLTAEERRAVQARFREIFDLPDDLPDADEG